MSILGQQLKANLHPGMVLPDAFEALFQWIEARGTFVDTAGGRVGTLFPQAEIQRGRSDSGRPGGTDIEFFADKDRAKAWFGHKKPATIERLCIFARTGSDGSMAAFWLADDGTQRIVHMGSGSGSVMTCVLADDPVDFLRLIAIGYDEICWGEVYSEPPNADPDFIVQPNVPYREWVEATFKVSIPERASEIVPASASSTSMDDKDPDDIFCKWTRQQFD